MCFEDARDLIAIEGRHHHVEQDEVRGLLFDRGQRFVTACCIEGQVALVLEQQLEQLSVLDLVIDDQDGGKTGAYDSHQPSSALDVGARMPSSVSMQA
jgi:hypothetical protein